MIAILAKMIPLHLHSPYASFASFPAPFCGTAACGTSRPFAKFAKFAKFPSPEPSKRQCIICIIS
jgi:hypothetical protein